MDRFPTCLCLLGLASLLTGCSDLEPPASPPQASPSPQGQAAQPLVSIKQVNRVLSGVNSLGEPSVSIRVGSSRNHLFDLTLLRANIHPGYRVRSLSYSHPEVELITRWNGDLFTQSTKFPTSVEVTIQSISTEAAVLSFSGLLVNAATGGYVRLSPSQITITGKDLEELLHSR
ncbi:hypothetical protein HDC30_002483 [Pseudomonas sp. JAI115]|uniref:hypothetical protein n=1 Tax=Pseudomonas sp. JAI115 TaxID=2723061 RepID=UPI00161F0CDD|nr:hypothetical protein [Pseudomonas sp. JAI115]MBB6155260.1 hypothetical protein [Pseudomonas sp. JAI115]